jgi:hypothetical protein
MTLPTTTRPDITCPKSGEPIPLDMYSCSKWNETHWNIYCPTCRVWHRFIAKPKPYSRACLAYGIPGATCQNPNCDC